jgi:hypothetical protein
MSTRKKQASPAPEPKTSIWSRLFGWVPTILQAAFAFLRNAGLVAAFGFFGRYWVLLLLIALLLLLVFSNVLFAIIGQMVWLPAWFLSVVIVALFGKNVVFRDTTDKYSDSGQYAKDFHALDPLWKVLITKVELWLLILAAALVAAALAGR